MIRVANTLYTARAWLAGHYNTQVWWRQQLTYLPWLICTGLGNIFYGLASSRHAR